MTTANGSRMRFGEWDAYGPSATCRLPWKARSEL